MTDSSPEPAAHPLPLFYREPKALSANRHAAWRLSGGDFRFAADASHVSIVIEEFASAQRHYPIVFAGDDGFPVALLGLERRNLFVDDQGQWAADTYVPAYVRRYPFAFMTTVEPDGFLLAIDAASDRVIRSGEEGMALFEDGKPSDLTRQAFDFCTAFGRDAEMTRLFVSALRDKGLLIDRRADATLPDGRKLGLDGFQIVDAEKFAQLDADTITAWHRQGLLALVYYHLASLDRLSSLLNRQASGEMVGRDVTPSSSADTSSGSNSGAVPATPAAISSSPLKVDA